MHRSWGEIVRRGVVLAGSMVIGVGLVTVGAVSAGAKAKGAGPGNSANAKKCHKGGWNNFVRSDGTAFANQGACVSYAAKGGVLMTPAQQQCKAELEASGLPTPTDPNYVAGTPGDDNFTSQMTAGNDVVCGFAGHDRIGSPAELEGDDIFLGGDGNDSVANMSGGTFNGGADPDNVGFGESPTGLTGGTFNGGDGIDVVARLSGGTFNGGDGNDRVQHFSGGTGTFNGGAGDDLVTNLVNGTFNGGDGNDLVDAMFGGTFNGGAGDDRVSRFLDGTFNGDAGCDTVRTPAGGTFNPGDQPTTCTA